MISDIIQIYSTYGGKIQQFKLFDHIYEAKNARDSCLLILPNKNGQLISVPVNFKFKRLVFVFKQSEFILN